MPIEGPWSLNPCLRERPSTSVWPVSLRLGRPRRVAHFAGLNIGVHKEAAEHILAALSLHSRDAEKEQRDSTPMWLTLRRALIALVSRELGTGIEFGRPD
jgi:hypothetical protein